MDDEKKQIAVFLCVWKRLGQLSKSLSQLKNQTFKGFDLVIINNNPFEGLFVENTAYDILHDSGIDYTVIHSKVNHGPMIRYAEAVDYGFPYSVFLDDDEDFKETMMADFNKVKEPKSLKAQMGFTFDKDIKARKRVLEGTAKVLGPGGMILDTSILTYDFFEKWKLEFYVCDDLWLSFFAEKKGYKKEVAHVNVFLQRETDKNIAMLFNENIAELKQKFVDIYGWHS